MSRITYCEPDDDASFLRCCAFDHNMKQAIKGKKGQRILKELEGALLALPEKRLINDGFATPEGDVCAMAALMLSRLIAGGLSKEDAMLAMKKQIDFDPASNWDAISGPAEVLKICEPLVWAIVEQNDEYSGRTPEETYDRVLAWVRSHIKQDIKPCPITK